MTLRFRRVALVAAGLCVTAVVLRWCGGPSPPARKTLPAPPTARPAPYAPPAAIPYPRARAGAETCDVGRSDAARRNRDGLRGLVFAPFHRSEIGWEIYEPLVAHEIGTVCDGGSAAFAGDLAAWQSAHGLNPDGVMDATTFAALKAIWQARRPFVAANRRGCPTPPAEAGLAPAPAAESYGGKSMLLRPAALEAFDRMRAAARAQSPAVRADPRLMTLFSAYRSPGYDAARCARDGDCQGVTRASCSPHRTGLAMDLYLGAAPGYGPDSSQDANRLYISRGPAYRWMAANAERFGFAPYAFEPWHWEWTGEPI